MDGNTPMESALRRGVIAALVVGIVAGITAYLAFTALIDDAAQTVGDITDNEIAGYAVLTGVLAGLAALLWRGIAEGKWDDGRAARFEQKPGDVHGLSPRSEP